MGTKLVLKYSFLNYNLNYCHKTNNLTDLKHLNLSLSLYLSHENNLVRGIDIAFTDNRDREQKQKEISLFSIL